MCSHECKIPVKENFGMLLKETSPTSTIWRDATRNTSHSLSRKLRTCNAKPKVDSFGANVRDNGSEYNIPSDAVLPPSSTADLSLIPRELGVVSGAVVVVRHEQVGRLGSC